MSGPRRSADVGVLASVLMDERILHAVEPVRRRPEAAAVLLDLDGTLAPIVPDPNAVRIAPPIRELLPALRDRYGLVAFVSGRHLDDLRRIVALDGVAYSGNHGLQIVDRNGWEIPVAGLDVTALQAFARNWSTDMLSAEGIWLENKQQTLTFHYRNAPDPLSAAEYLRAHVAPRGVADGLRVEPGRMSLEVHPAGAASKGTAVAALLERHPTIASVISLGDDRTDTTVWRLLHDRLASGGLTAALAVGVVSDETPQVVRDHADLLVPGVSGSGHVLAALV